MKPILFIITLAFSGILKAHKQEFQLCLVETNDKTNLRKAQCNPRILDELLKADMQSGAFKTDDLYTFLKEIQRCHSKIRQEIKEKTEENEKAENNRYDSALETKKTDLTLTKILENNVYILLEYCPKLNPSKNR